MDLRAWPVALAVTLFAMSGCIDDTPDVDPPADPVAVIDTAGTHFTAGRMVALNGNASFDPQGGDLTHFWDLGDGTFAQGPLVVHTYDTPGNVTVTLTVTSGTNATANTSVDLVIAETEYRQHVIMNWDKQDLDVLIAHVEDPVVGAAIQEAIDAWDVGIRQLAPELNITFRVYWPGTGGAPPSDFDPDIYFLPVGFMAITNFPHTGTCTAWAPVGYIGPDPLDLEELYFTAAHEFGHCLGLSHVFHKDVEYQPAFDLLGAGSVHHEWGRSCPSNLNIELLRVAFGEPGDGLRNMPSTEYFQADC